VQWVQIAVFGETAEQLAGCLSKADRVYVEGRLQLNRWQKDGQERSGLSVAAWKAEKLGAIGRNKPARDRDAGDAEAPRKNSARQPTAQEPFDDSLPF
jgi:single-strand DNA-binding protein